MKQIIQSYKTGEMKLEQAALPQVMPGSLLLETMASLVSAGTDRMLVGFTRKSLVGKARSKLDNPIPLGYSCAGVVRKVGEEVHDFQLGDWVVGY